MSAKTERSGISGKAGAAASRRPAGTKIKYTNEPVEARVVRDFLPPPEELAFREEGVKVTIALSRKSVDFFKSEAAKHHTQYQRMIRRLIDTYVDNYAQSPASSPVRNARKRAAE